MCAMPITIKTILKSLLWAVAALLFVSVLVIIWLRQEFARVSSEGVGSAYWQTIPVEALASKPEADCLNRYPHKRAFFGALHVHTAASYDAMAFGSTTTVDQAYRFARGEPLALALRGDPED